LTACVRSSAQRLTRILAVKSARTTATHLNRGASSFSLWFDVEPRGQERVRFTRTGRAYTPAKTRKITEQIRQQWEALGSPEVETEWFSVRIVAVILPPKNQQHPLPPRPDADNIAKLMMDALQGHAFPNDSRCWQLSVAKRYGEKQGISVTFGK
jgi:Holliday junction resolvase RusA-like endonuclease